MLKLEDELKKYLIGIEGIQNLREAVNYVNSFLFLQPRIESRFWLCINREEYRKKYE